MSESQKPDSPAPTAPIPAVPTAPTVPTASAAPAVPAGPVIPEPVFDTTPAPTAKRLFIAIRVSLATSNALAGATETLARRARDGRVDIRWVAPASYHVTLKFLGWTRLTAIEAIRDALDEATRGTPRITLRTTRLGAFPSVDKASVLWAGVEEQSGALAELVARIETAMIGLGFPAETRPFHAHVTLGRLRENRPLKEVVIPLAEQMFGDTRVEAITLIESETKSSGSVYRDISRIEFKAKEMTAERQTRAVDLGASTQTSESDDTDDGWPRGQGPNH